MSSNTLVKNLKKQVTKTIDTVLTIEQKSNEKTIKKLNEMVCDLIDANFDFTILNEKELRALELFSAGYDIKEVANLMNKTSKTIGNYRQSIISKFHAMSITEVITKYLLTKSNLFNSADILDASSFG